MSVLKPVHETFGLRFLVVGFLPGMAAGAFVAFLAGAGAPGELSFKKAWKTAADFSAGKIVLAMLGLTLLALLLHPLQLVLVRFLEGYWPEPFRNVLAWRHEARRDRLARRTRLPEGDDPDAVQLAGQAGGRLRQEYPPGRVLPTRLGNALGAAEFRAGSEYGWDAVVAWPRLYPVLGDRMKAVVDDRRNSLDAAARLAAMGLATAVVAALLLLRSGWWVTLAGVPVVIAWASYRGAVAAAISYGEAVCVAFDLHRFDLVERLRLKLPQDQDEECALAEALCTRWRQMTDEPRLAYEHVEVSPWGNQPGPGRRS